MPRVLVALLPALVLVLAWSASMATADTGEVPLYESHFILHSQATAGEASSVCSTQHSGFLPNLYIMTQYLTVSHLLNSGAVGYNTYVALSGTRNGSTCTTNANCAWKWNGGPLQSSPVTFYLGRQPSVAQNPANANLWDAWDTNCPTVNSTSSSNVALYTGTYMWRDSDNGLRGTVFVCEVLGPAPAAASSKKTSIPWWAILIIVVGGVAIVAGVAAGIAVYCCRKRRQKSAAQPSESETASMVSVRTLDPDEVARKWRRYQRQRRAQRPSTADSTATGRDLTHTKKKSKKKNKKGGKKKKGKKGKKRSAKARAKKKARNADTASQTTDSTAFSRRSDSMYTESTAGTVRSESVRSLALDDSVVTVDVAKKP